MSHTLVTGATGLIGRWLIPELSRDRDVVALVRRANEREAELRAWITAHGGDASRVTVIEGDLAAAGLGLDAAGRRLVTTARDVFHAGALMQFGMTEAVARPANVDGTDTLISLALESTELRRFVHVSGFKVGDDEPFRALGLDPDGPYERAAYDRLYAALGGYEASKMEADHLVRDAARTRGLPLARIHPGAVIGDSRTGETTQFFGFAPLVQQLWRGKLPAVPGGEQHWLPLVAVDFLAAFMARVPEHAATLGGSYVLLDDASPQLVELVARVADRVGMRAPQRRLPIGVVRTLLRTRLVPGNPGDLEGLSFIADRRYDTGPTRRLATAMGLAWPSLDAAIARSVDFLLATRFGTQQASPGGSALRRVAGAPAFVVGEPARADVVMLHGLPLDADSWSAVAARVGGTQLRVDLPGLNRSASAGASPLEWMESLLADATAPALLVGHSLGTHYAVAYAAAHPERVRGLVLIAPAFAQQPPPAIMRCKRSARLAARGIRRRHLEALVAASPGSAGARSNAQHCEVENDRRARTAVLDGPVADLDRPGARARFGEILALAHGRRAALQQQLVELAAVMPVLLISGTRDPIVADTGAAETLVFEGVGHFPQLDRPTEVAAAIERMRARTAVARAA